MPSENNWNPAKVTDQNSLIWKDIPGTGSEVRLQFLKGDTATIMTAFAADFNAYIEKLRDLDSCAYTPTNSVATSNHLNGTAMDLNWNNHPFQVRGTFSSAQMKVIKELVGSDGVSGFYEGMMFWAGNWDSPIDEMHWQMGYNSYQNSATRTSFIKRKIRSDGFSIFRRGGGSTPAPVTPEYPSQEQMIREIYDRLIRLPWFTDNKWPSTAWFRDNNNGIGDTVALLRYAEGEGWDAAVVNGALVGDLEQIARVKRLADGQGPEGKNVEAVNFAKALLRRIEGK